MNQNKISSYRLHPATHTLNQNYCYWLALLDSRNSVPKYLLSRSIYLSMFVHRFSPLQTAAAPGQLADPSVAYLYTWRTTSVTIW